jgi:hypothetical protein
MVLRRVYEMSKIEGGTNCTQWGEHIVICYKFYRLKLNESSILTHFRQFVHLITFEPVDGFAQNLVSRSCCLIPLNFFIFLSFSTITNTDMAAVRTYEVGITLLPLHVIFLNFV